MSQSHCPLCYSELKVTNCTPCMDCGFNESEIEHLEDHSFKEYELYFGQRLTFCNFCDVDFGSYKPEHFGFPKDKKIGYEDFKFIKDIEDKILSPDKYCSKCMHRLPFLNFIHMCREKNDKKGA